MLIATNYAKKMAADMRLINESIYEDHPNHKVNVCARKVAELYQQSTPHKGTQIIFSDIGTPKLDAFNLYDALKQKLITDFQIPADHISFIHDWSDKQKPELFHKMNQGEIRILIGSTEKAGTGLNVQERVIALHHLDIPWKPSELEQRNGRGARQGNWLAREQYGNKVQCFVYAVEQSLDNYKFNLLKNKQTFISQMKNCELNVRTIDEGAVDEKSGMNFSEYIAILSGDTTLLEKSKLEKKIAVLESLKVAHYREQSKAKTKLDTLIQEKSVTGKILNYLKEDYSWYHSQLQYEKDGTKANPIHLTGLAVNEPEAIGKYLIRLHTNWNQEQTGNIGTLYGFDLYIKREREEQWDTNQLIESYSNSFYAQRSGSEIQYTFNHGQPNKDNPKLAARHFLNAIDRVDSLLAKYQKYLEELKANQTILTELTCKPFDKENDLIQMKNDLARIEREITLKIQHNQLKQVEQAEQKTISSIEKNTQPVSPIVCQYVTQPLLKVITRHTKVTTKSDICKPSPIVKRHRRAKL
ncbi:helicase-related protein [Cytophagaceae bacterium DM2B3-1]|uniref:Helicase-related protein n=1 Tax=Xanthocytophaga flava TaxID=3048013 RepID=A0ABT7CIY7_9BACT|nr:helicase-related protein [Xanthocytophaga flavus]MDJ1493695.1 helicase-related protein [Xanthocytophaga flavus]